MDKSNGPPGGQATRQSDLAARPAEAQPPTPGGLAGVPIPGVGKLPTPSSPIATHEHSTEFDDDDEVTRLATRDPLSGPLSQSYAPPAPPAPVRSKDVPPPGISARGALANMPARGGAPRAPTLMGLAPPPGMSQAESSPPAHSQAPSSVAPGRSLGPAEAIAAHGVQSAQSSPPGRLGPGGTMLIGAPSSKSSTLESAQLAPHVAAAARAASLGTSAEVTSPRAQSPMAQPPASQAGAQQFASHTPVRAAQTMTASQVATGSHFEATTTTVRTQIPNRVVHAVLFAIAALLTVMLIAGLAMLVMPRRGELVINVTGPQGEVVDGLTIFVDGKSRCTSSPCKLTALPPGAHAVKAAGYGYAPTAERQVVVDAKREALIDLSLPPDPGTGVRASSKVAGLRLSVDGRDVGTVPREVGGLSPGEHTLKVAGNPGFGPVEKKVLVAAQQMVEVDLSPPVLEGTLRIERGANADYADIELKIGEEQRRLPSLPTELAVQANPKPVITAVKKGFVDFSRTVEFVPGEPKLTVVVELTKEQEEQAEAVEKPAQVASLAAPPARTWTARTPRASGTSKKASAKADDDDEPAALNYDVAAGAATKQAASPSGTGKVSVNSIPPSNVSINGHDFGQTPQMGVEVPAGRVTAVFKHPELGTKTASGVVKPGGTLALSVRFKQSDSTGDSK